MAIGKRKAHSAEFKAKVALEAAEVIANAVVSP